MKSVITTTLALACAFATPSASAQAVIGDVDGFEKSEAIRLVADFQNWIVENSEYGESKRPLERIVFSAHGETVGYHGRTVKLEGQIRGLYDEATATIYLVKPWTSMNPYDRSVLLHELVHHIQHDAKHWYCPQAQEWDAYKLQDKWLAAHNLSGNFHWASILLESSCAVRDHHPD